MEAEPEAFASVVAAAEAGAGVAAEAVAGTDAVEPPLAVTDTGSAAPALVGAFDETGLPGAFHPAGFFAGSRFMRVCNSFV